MNSIKARIEELDKTCLLERRKEKEFENDSDTYI